MKNLLQADIEAQGENLPAVIEHLYSAERRRIESAARFLQNDRPILLTGIASAEYLCMPAALYLNQRGRPAFTMPASEVLYSMLPACQQANVVINSRSGETVEIIKLGQALVDNGIPFLAITNEPGSTLARMATHMVWSKTRKDDLVSINVVTGMMTTTLVVAAAATEEMDALRPDFERLGSSIGAVVARAWSQAAALRALFAGIRPIHLLYRGPARGAAYCGRLALEEIGRTPGVAMEAAEFRQGPNEVIDERFGAVVFAPGGKPGSLNRNLAENILQSGGRVLLVTGAGSPPLSENSSAQDRLLIFEIPALPDALRPALEVVPVQVLAYELARAQGYEPGQVRYISKVITTEEGIPNQ